MSYNHVSSASTMDGKKVNNEQSRVQNKLLNNNNKKKNPTEKTVVSLMAA